MTTETTETMTETNEEGEAVVPTPEGEEALRVADTGGAATATEEEEGKTFDLAYVQKLRKEAANYRERAGKAEELAHLLHLARVQASGKLQDPTDLPFDEAYIEDPEALTAAIDNLLAAKPHLASRKPQGFIPQGATSVESGGMTFGGLLRGSAV